MNTVYHCPDGVIRWTGETPSKPIISILRKLIMIGIPVLCVLTLIMNEFEDFFATISTFVLSMVFWRAILYLLEKFVFKGGQCMFYELDSSGLNIHEMNTTPMNLNALLSRYAKGDTVRFPDAKTTERIDRSQFGFVQPGKDTHTVVLKGNRELYTIGSAAELLMVFGVPQTAQPQGSPATDSITPPYLSGNTPAAPLKSQPTPAVAAPPYRSANTGTSFQKRAIPQMTQTAKIAAPKKGGTLKVHLPEKNTRILSEAIKSDGGLL